MSDLLTTKQLMDLLHIDRTTVYRMLNDGRLPAVRVGGQWRFQRQAIDKWLGEKTSTKTEANANTTSEPIEVLPIYCLQPIQEIFAQANDVGTVTTDLNGKSLIPVSNACALCNLILASEQGRARCEASWRKLASHTDQQPRLEKCHAGLTYARGRVVVQGQFIAMFFAGQFAVDDPEPIRSQEQLTKLATVCDVDQQALTNAAAELRVLSRARAERLLDLLQMVADTFSRIGQERLDLLTRLKRVAEIAGVATP